MTHYQNLLSVSHGDLNVSYGPDNSIIFESKNTEWNWYFEIDSEGYWVYFRKKIRLGDYIVWEKNSSINFDDVLSDIKQAK